MNTSEIFYILQGKRNHSKLVEEQRQIISQERLLQTDICSANDLNQFIENNGEIDLIALCIVHPAWKEDQMKSSNRACF